MCLPCMQILVRWLKILLHGNRNLAMTPMLVIKYIVTFEKSTALQKVLIDVLILAAEKPTV